MKELNEMLNKFLDEYCQKTLITGALRITSCDEISYERFIGKATPDGKDINKDSMFTLYSLSKPFCAIGIMKLYDKGLVDINAHPGKYLPEAKGFDSRVTISHLLHHVSGLPDYYMVEEFANKYKGKGDPENLREQTKIISQYPMNFEPGKGNLYENINYVIPALIIENVTGMPYAEYMKKEVFEPLGMKTALVDRKGLFVENRVMGTEIEGNRSVFVERVTDWLFGAGDIIGTLDDVYCLNKAIKNKVMLSEKAWEEILTPSPVNTMGKGCRISDWHGKKRITHNGGHVGFRTLHIELPEDDFDIIFLSNSGWGDARNVISEKIFEIYFGESDTEKDTFKMDAGYAK